MKDLRLPQHTRHDLVCKQQLSRKQSSSKVFGCFRERSRAKNTEIGEQFLSIQKRSKAVGQTLCYLKPGSAQSSTEGTTQGLLWKLESQSSTEEPIPQANTQIRILRTAKEGVIHT